MKNDMLFFLVLSHCFFVRCTTPIPEVDNNYNNAFRLNQIGYYPNAPKKIIVADITANTIFQIVDINTKAVVFTGECSAPESWNLSGETVKVGDFSKLKSEGSFMVYMKGLGYSYPFEIKNNVLRESFVGSIKGLYYQRASMALEEKYAGKWHRPSGHPDTEVLFHPSTGRQEGEISSPKGWYDAGDFNKYVVNGAFSLGQYFTLYEQYADLIIDGDLNIPESGNNVSDYLDEMKYQMDWMLTMQDEDGGSFHKLTTKDFGELKMPNENIQPRYIVGKSTTATLDFAGCGAQAYRVFKTIDEEYATKCLEGAKKAWNWAQKNPATEFKNPTDIHTGQYNDADFMDEWYWAAAELYTTTGGDEYLHYLVNNKPLFTFKPGESWTTFMKFSGLFSLLNEAEKIPEDMRENLESDLLKIADDLVVKVNTTAYFQPITDFQWGSNSDVLNAAIIIANAYRIEPKQEYLNAVQESTDYIFGKNATGYSFLTGFGSKTPMFIHHSQSTGDTVKMPVPGLLSGGPNNGKQDAQWGAVYPANVSPMQSWVDQTPSFASNEICLNWNAPLTYVLGFLEKESK